MKTMKLKESPCVRCKRVADPEKCDNKDCALWRHWFIARWDQLRAPFCKVMNIPLEDDPCLRCPIPETCCVGTCKAKREWEEKQ